MREQIRFGEGVEGCAEGPGDPGMRRRAREETSSSRTYQIETRTEPLQYYRRRINFRESLNVPDSRRTK